MEVSGNSKIMKNVLGFGEINAEDTDKVGTKGANLGELRNETNVPILPGYATTTEAYDKFIDENELREKIGRILDGVDTDDIQDLQRRGKQIRSQIRESDMPEELRKDFVEAYEVLEEELGVDNPSVAVRSSVSSEKMPGSSLKEDQETYLNVSGRQDLIKRVKDCFASLFTNKAISYRENKNLNHFDLKLSAVVQKMGRSDIGSSGVMFTLDQDTGFQNVVTINGSYGLGNRIFEGDVNPDEFTVFKENLGIVEKRLGDKEVKLRRGDDRESKEVEVPLEDRKNFCITDNQVKEVAKYGMRIEDHFGKAMKVEWVLDGQSKEIYIVDACPESVQSKKDEKIIKDYKLQNESSKVLEGVAVGSKIGDGEVHVVDSPKQVDEFEEGDVLVTDITDPDWEPLMKKSGAVITNKGGRTSHAAIISRELDLPAVVGTQAATSKLKNGQKVTVDCSGSTGKIWSGKLDYEVNEHHVDDIPETSTDVQLNISDPSEAFQFAQLPVQGVGMVREEFILSSQVEEHPLKLIEEGRGDKYVEALRSGIGKIGAAFHPGQVVVRLSDFTSKEYARLEGGEEYEEKEDNPLLGFRGASRYQDTFFKKAFELECKALRKCIEELELDNIVVMVPFCRTIEEGKKVRAKIKQHGLDEEDVDVYLKVDTPANVLLAENLAEVFDGFSIGTNDLTQLTLGVDRNSDKVGEMFDEKNQAVKKSVSNLINKAHGENRHVGICGDAPSTREEYISFLVEEGIDAISVSPEKALETILRVKDVEQRVETSEIKTESSDYEPEGSEFKVDVDVETSIGGTAGRIYDTLKEEGEAKANQLLNFTADQINHEKLHEGLGWLAKEGKIEMEREDGEVKYKLKP